MNEYQTWTSWVGVLPWWYTIVPAKLARHQSLLLFTVVDYFSFGILLKTLFEPWKRDELSTERMSLQQRFQIWGFNFIARGFGFGMRTMAIVAGLVALCLLFLLFFFLWLSWLLAPFIAIALIALGLFTVVGGMQ